MEYCFSAVEDNRHPLHILFNGDKNSPIYLQLFIAYKIYHYVVSKRQSYTKADVEDFVFYADEFISYGIYKLLSFHNMILEYENAVEENYHKAFQALAEVVEYEKDRLAKLGLTYSHNDYFKSERLVSDFNEKLGLQENENKFEYLKRMFGEK